MASTHNWTWGSRDDIWHIAAYLLQQSGYPSVSAFVDAIRAANPAVLDWQAVPEDTVIVVPFAA